MRKGDFKIGSMKRGQLTTITTSKSIKKMLIELRKITDSCNWDTFFLALATDIMKVHNIDISLDADTLAEIENIKTKK